MKKIILKFGVIITVIFLVLSQNTFSASQNYTMLSDEEQKDLSKKLANPYDGDNLSLGRCFYKGNIDFVLFLQTLIYSDGFKEGVLEPFRDIFSRNQCHSSDVLNLIKQRDKIREAIRSAFLNCRNDRIPMLKRAYNLVNAEIYYVRHIVDGVISLSLPLDTLNTLRLESEESLYTSDEEMYKKMKEKYLGSMFSEDELNLLYRNLRTKYSKRKIEYVNCNSGSFKVLAEKFNEFIDNFGGISPAIEDAKMRIGGRAEKIWEAITDPGLADYLSSIINININSMPAKMGASEILSYLSEFGEFPDYGDQSFSSFFGQLDLEDQKFLMETKKAELASSYIFLYRDNLDQSIEKFLDELNEIDQSILNTIDNLDLLFDCTFAINSRQCPNK